MPWRPGSVTSAPDPTRKAYSARSNPWLYIYCIGPSLVPVLVAVFMLYTYCLHSTRMKFVPYSRGIGYLWPQTEELVWSIVTGKSTFILHYITLHYKYRARRQPYVSAMQLLPRQIRCHAVNQATLWLILVAHTTAVIVSTVARTSLRFRVYIC